MREMSFPNSGGGCTCLKRCQTTSRNILKTTYFLDECDGFFFFVVCSCVHFSRFNREGLLKEALQLQMPSVEENLLRFMRNKAHRASELRSVVEVSCQDLLFHSEMCWLNF